MRTFTYDSFSRLLTATNPESGQISYSYDADGNMLQKASPAPNQTGSATQTISYCYDKLNRVTGKAYSAQTCTNGQLPAGTAVVSYTYDAGANGIGRLTSLTDQAGSGSYSFDALGRIGSKSRTIAGIQKNLAYTYNLDNSVATLKYPSGAVVTYTPDAAGRILSAVDSGNNINYITGATYGPDSSLTGFISGNSSSFAGITNTFSYNTRLQPCRLSATTGAPPASCTDGTNIGNVIDLSYDFHLGSGDNGNVFRLVNNKDLTRIQTFTYDALNRLTSAQNAGTDCTKKTVNNLTEYWGNSYGYDAWGSLLQKTVTKCSAENLSVTALANNQLSGYNYDAAGNMTHDATTNLNYSFDQENRITGAAGYTYSYDADGNRVEKSNGTTGTIYWYMSPGIVGESDLTGSLKSEYLFFAGERVARKDFPGNAVFYYFSDHLKTASVITNASGTITEDEDYYPWGGELQFVNSDNNHYKFTGKERDAETGLDYFGARYYGNWTGRFLTPDWSSTPVPVPYADLSDPQSLNQYSYVRNIPTSQTDGDGHCPPCPVFEETGVLTPEEDAIHDEATVNKMNDAIYRVEVKVLSHPAVQAVLEVAPFAGGGGKAISGTTEGAAEAAAEAAESATAKGVEEGVARGTAKGAEKGAVATPKDPTPAPYNRSEHYGNPATSKAAKDIRAKAEGEPCPSCGETMQSGTKNAPTAQHSPTLKSHYYRKGHRMTPAQRRAYARSKESMNGAACKECQSKEGAAESRK